jgi:ABC-type transporter Mla MlaB component
LPVSVEKDEARYLIRLEGEVGLAEAAELKSLLLEGLASGRTLQLDLKRIAEIDVTVMQLLQAALREADQAGTVMTARMSEAAESALRGAGFGIVIEAAGWTS